MGRASDLVSCLAAAAFCALCLTALIGLVKIKTQGAAVFVPNTTALNATNVVNNILNCTTMPTIPHLS